MRRFQKKHGDGTILVNGCWTRDMKTVVKLCSGCFLNTNIKGCNAYRDTNNLISFTRQYKDVLCAIIANYSSNESINNVIGCNDQYNNLECSSCKRKLNSSACKNYRYRMGMKQYE